MNPARRMAAPDSDTRTSLAGEFVRGCGDGNACATCASGVPERANRPHADAMDGRIPAHPGVPVPWQDRDRQMGNQERHNSHCGEMRLDLRDGTSGH
jgi:hypothetical protein